MIDGGAPPSAATQAARIAAWSSGLDLAAVPADVVHAARRCIVDVVGVTLAAVDQPLTRRVLEHARQVYAPGAASVLGFPDHLAPVGAALVNGTAGHVLDFDDTSYTGIMHGSTVVLPAALAATQAVGGSGRRLLEAFIAGAEVAYAVALLATTRHYFSGWWSTATCGVFGAAAAAARALGLSVSETTAALALAGTQAGGLKVAFGTDAKPCGAGRAAAAGVEAALLASRGVGGPEAVLEGGNGFLQLFDAGRCDTRATGDLGRVWRLTEPGILFKQYPVCSGAHAAVELTQRLLLQHGLTGEHVRTLVCEVTPVVAMSLVHERPATWQQGQFSLPFALGTVLARGELDLTCLRDDALLDPALRSAMAKVEMRRVDAMQTDEAPEAARITLTTRDGGEFSGYLGVPTGMPGNPLSDAQLHGKFLRCAAAGGIGPAAAQELLAHLAELETAPAALPPREPGADRGCRASRS